jgi:hypothetical protein
MAPRPRSRRRRDETAALSAEPRLSAQVRAFGQRVSVVPGTCADDAQCEPGQTCVGYACQWAPPDAAANLDGSGGASFVFTGTAGAERDGGCDDALEGGGGASGADAGEDG